jgi:hypothetical protein
MLAVERALGRFKVLLGWHWLASFVCALKKRLGSGKFVHGLHRYLKIASA